MPTPGYPPDPALPSSSGPDPDFIPAPSFVSPAQFRDAYDGMSPDTKARARKLLVDLGKSEYLAALEG
ncbi:MAG TPA: hypothetical protein VFM12_06370 [Gemmatimonadales bacterium]|nr:hypothetical protein [Gemmatimonadales bacterium]